MNTYFTAKDIEELAVNGTKQLVLGPETFLTDFARETAQQMGITLVRSEDQVSERKPESSLPKVRMASSKYNKPRGCIQGSRPRPDQNAKASNPSSHANVSNSATNANSVNKLIELMGKVIKRGS